jgi:hypothetical protein
LANDEKERVRQSAIRKRDLALEGLCVVLDSKVASHADEHDMELVREELETSHLAALEQNVADLESTTQPPPLSILRKTDSTFDQDNPLFDAPPDQQGTLEEELEEEYGHEALEIGDEGCGSFEEEQDTDDLDGEDSDVDEDIHGSGAGEEDYDQGEIDPGDSEDDSEEGEMEDLDYFEDEDAGEECISAAADRFGDNEYDIYHSIPHPTAGKPIYAFDKSRIPLNRHGPWFPFKNAVDFKTASFLIRHNHTKAAITEGFNRGIYTSQQTDTLSFSSAYTLRKLVEQMEPDFQSSEWNVGKAKFFADVKNEIVDFWYRNISKVIKHFFRQPAYRELLIYKPVKDFNHDGQRVYSDLHTAKWWWEQQVRAKGLLTSIDARNRTLTGNEVWDWTLTGMDV